MLYYNEFDYSVLKNNRKTTIRHKKQDYSKTIYAFDIETTTVFIDSNGKQHQWQNPKNDEERTMFKNCHKYGLMYLWQFAIFKTEWEKPIVLYGRTWEEYIEMLNNIEVYDKAHKKIWVHNLSYEYQYLLNVDETLKPFARAPRKVINAKSSKWNLEYNCTLFLTNLKLEKLPSFYGTQTEKLVDNMNYDIIRTSATELDKDTLNYAENDVIILCEVIAKECQTYDNVAKIPMTSTSKIRKQIKKLFQGDMNHYWKVSNASPKTAEEFEMLMQCYQGGYTHANSYYAGDEIVINNVLHIDFASSYPAVLVYEKYPVNRFKPLPFKPTSFEKLDKENYAYIFKFKAKNVKCKYYNTFISQSKCKKLEYDTNDEESHIDNGRVISCDYLELTCTDVDFFIYQRAYEMEIIDCEIYYSFKYYLPKKLVNFILQVYYDKCTKKDAPPFVYNNIKAQLNGIYGCSVTNNIARETIFNIDDENGEIWKLSDALTKEQIEEQLQYQYHNPNKCRNFLPIGVGVWCSAHARANLLDTVLRIEDTTQNVYYCDTDSIFTDNNEIVKKVIEEKNIEIIDKIKKACYNNGIDFEMTQPIYKNKQYQLGVFTEEDDTGCSFRTFGAKKYATQFNDKVKITISGVAKSACKYLNTIEDFKIGLLFDESMSGKKTLFYNDNQTEFDVVDYQGNLTHINQKYAIAMMSTTYKLGVGVDYAQLLEELKELAERTYYY